MATDFERVNAPRVEKSLKFIASINKSAKSYRVSGDELNELLVPLREALAVESPQTDASESSGKSGGDIVGVPTPANMAEMSWVKWALERLIQGDKRVRDHNAQKWTEGRKAMKLTDLLGDAIGIISIAVVVVVLLVVAP